MSPIVNLRLLLSTIFTLVFILTFISNVKMDSLGVMIALISGAITSGISNVIWFAALKRLNVSDASVVQLSVPIIAAIGGAFF